MSTPKIGTTIVLQGEKEYRDAIKNIDAGLKVLKSEMKVVSETFADNADSVNALTARNDVLDRSISKQKEKIEQLEQVLKKSADTYGESNTRTMQWQTSLNNAQAELVRMERELKNSIEAIELQTDAIEAQDQALEASTGNFQGFGDAISSAANKLGVNLPEGAVNSMNSLGNLDMKTVAAVGSFAALAAAIIKAEKALYDMTAEAAASAVMSYRAFSALIIAAASAAKLPTAATVFISRLPRLFMEFTAPSGRFTPSLFAAELIASPKPWKLPVDASNAWS